MRNKPRKFTEEEIKFIKDNAYGLTVFELMELFSARFQPVTEKQMRNFLSRKRIHLGRKTIYKEEHLEFIKKYFCNEKHTLNETIAEFQRLWPALDMSVNKMVSILNHRNLRNGMNGRIAESQFKKGCVPYNTLKEGQKSKWGKLNVVKHNGVQKTQARANWEDKYGEIPKGYGVIHIDGNKENDDVSNLTLIDAKERGKMIYNKLTDDVETNEMIIARVKLESALERKMNENSKNSVGS